MDDDNYDFLKLSYSLCNNIKLDKFKFHGEVKIIKVLRTNYS